MLTRRSALTGTATVMAAAATPALAAHDPDATLLALAEEWDRLSRAYNERCRDGDPDDAIRRAYIAREDRMLADMFAIPANGISGMYAKLRVSFPIDPDQTMLSTDFPHQQECLASVYRDLERLAGRARS